MMQSFNGNHSENNESSDNSSFFSPSRGRRVSLHPATPDANDDSLPRLHDSSWIGAKVSPIQSYEDDEDDEENELTISRYYKALNDSLFAGGAASESTSLLGGTNRQNRWNIHPLWDNQDPFALEQTRLKSPTYKMGIFVMTTSGILLAVIGLHDAYLWYLSFRRGTELKYSVAWALPWFLPSNRTLLRFGGFSPLHLVQQGQYWRIITSWFLSTSLVEWILTGWSWWYVQYLPLRMVSTLYFMCCITGQLWMAAFDLQGVSGTTSWGTAGILCTIGVLRPDRRHLLFSFAISLVIINLFQAPRSVYGAIGASFFGWSFAGVGLTNNLSSPRHKDDASKQQKEFNVFAAVVLIALWFLPILFVLWSNGKRNN